ncbi:MAG: polysaccharide deacetylase family protein [Candidatus Omnitrophica bacterium]|nr:polysaccharide deacetylase family protein [Candidatus Omnitrophota bacterium]
MYATIQVDLDSLWTYDRYLYQKINNYPVDPVYSQSLQSFLDLFAKYKLKATFFIIGKDVQNPKQSKYIKMIIEQGHEIANHSMNHLSDFAALSLEQIREEIILAHNLIKSVINKDPVGFRAPMFSINQPVIRVLEDLGYKYDASLMPSAIFPLMMNTAHSLLKLKPVNLKCGNIRWGDAPRGIYHPDKQNMAKPGAMEIKEVPVSVSNFARFPMHSTYVFVFGKFLFDSGFNYALKNKITLHYLFHGIDLLNIEQYSLKLPGFKTLTKRQKICEQIVKKLAENSQVVTTENLIAIGKETHGIHPASGI